MLVALLRLARRKKNSQGYQKRITRERSKRRGIEVVEEVKDSEEKTGRGD